MRRFTVFVLTLMVVATYTDVLSGTPRHAAVQEQIVEGSWNARFNRREPDRTRMQLSVWEDRGRNNNSMPLTAGVVDRAPRSR